MNNYHALNKLNNNIEFWINRINYGLLCVLFLILPFAFSRYTKQNFLSVKETWFRYFVIVMFALLIFRVIQTGRWRNLKFPGGLSLIPFIAIVLLSWSWTIRLEISIFETAVIISYLMYYLVLANTLTKSSQFITLISILLAGAAISSIYGFLQYYGIDPLFAPEEVIGNVDRKRVFSFFGNPVFLGVYLDSILPLAFAFTFVKWNSRLDLKQAFTQLINTFYDPDVNWDFNIFKYFLWKAFGIISGALIMLCLVITFTRSAWLAVFSSFTFFILVSGTSFIKEHRLAFISSAVVLTIMVSIFLLPSEINPMGQSVIERFQNMFTVKQRLMLWDSTAIMISEKPMTGYGIGAFGYLYPLYQEKFFQEPMFFKDKVEEWQWLAAGFAHAHNEYLEVWADLGIFGLLAFLLGWGMFFFNGFKLLKLLKLNNNENSPLIIGFMAAGVAIMTESLPNFPLQRIMPIVIFGVCLLAIHRGRAIWAEEQLQRNTEKNNEQKYVEGLFGLFPNFHRIIAGLLLGTLWLLTHRLIESIPYQIIYASLIVLAIWFFPPPTDISFQSSDEKSAPPLSRFNWFLNEIRPFYAAILCGGVICLLYFPHRYIQASKSLKAGHMYLMHASAAAGDNQTQLRSILKEALNELQYSLKLVPFDAETLFWIADVNRIMNQYDVSLKYLEETLKYGNNKHIYFTLGMNYLGKSEASREPDPKKRMEYRDLASYYFSRAAAINPNYAAPYYQLGMMNFQERNYSQAAEKFNLASRWMRRDGPIPGLPRIAGISNYFAENYSIAIEHFEKALEIRDLSNDTRAEMLRFLGGSYFNINDYHNAIKTWEESVSYYEDPGIIRNLYHYMGISAYRLARESSSEETSREHLQNSEDFYLKAIALLKYGGIEVDFELEAGLGEVYQQMQLFDNAISRFSRAASVRQTPDIFHKLALVHYFSHRFDSAIELWQKASRLDPATPNYFFNQGVVQMENGNYAQALENFIQTRKLEQGFHPEINSIINTCQEIVEGKISPSQLSLPQISPGENEQKPPQEILGSF